MAKKRKTDEPEIILDGLTEETTDQKLESSGLGDMIASITTAIGIEPCAACERRKEALNKAFPWLKASRDVTEEEIDFIKKITSTHTLNNDDVNRLFSLYNDVFSSKLSRCACSGLISKMIQRLGVLLV